MRSIHPTAEIIEEVGSGLNFKRKKLLSVLERAMQGEKFSLVVAHRDRLARFGFQLIDFIIRHAGGEIVVLDDATASAEQELTTDLLAILHHFSCRMQGARSHQGCKSGHKEDSDLPDGAAKADVHALVRGFKESLQRHGGDVELDIEAGSLDECGEKDSCRTA